MNTLKRLSEYRFSTYQLSLFRQLGEYKGRQPLTIRQQPEVLDTLRQVAVMESVEYSNHLDGIMVTREVARKLVLKEYKPITPMDRQVAGYRDALDIVVEPGEHMTLSVAFSQQLHAMLYGHMPHEGGRWRVTNKDIVERDKDGQKIGVLYRTAPVAEIAMAMNETVSLYHSHSQHSVEPLLLIAAAVLDYLCIDPFSDGNGRISRLLMLLMLSLSGYQLGRFISIERLLAREEDAYKRALQQSVKGWHEGKHDVMPWLDFFLFILAQGYNELEEKIDALQGKGSRAPKSQLVKTAIEKIDVPFSIADICIQIPTVSRELVKKVVQQLRTEEKVRQVGKGRGAHWEKV